MKDVSIHFAPTIRAHARSRNLVLSQSEIDHLGQTLNSVAEIETGDHPMLSFSLGGDRRGDLNAALDVFAIGFGRSEGTEISRTTPTALTAAAQTATTLAIAKNAEIRAGSAATKQQQARQLCELFGNPWAADRPNRTNAAYVTLHHPELAQQLKRQAGVRS